MCLLFLLILLVSLSWPFFLGLPGGSRESIYRYVPDTKGQEIMADMLTIIGMLSIEDHAMVSEVRSGGQHAISL